MKRWLANAPVPLLLLCALLTVARTRRSPADGHGMPEVIASAGPAASAAPRHATPEDDLIVTRINDRLADAVVDVPRVDAESALHEYWRRSPAPFIDAAGPRRGLVQQVSLVMPLGPGESDVGPGMVSTGDDAGVSRLDQREALVAPPPGTVKLRVDVPDRARFLCDIAAIGPTTPVTFEVAIRKGAERTVVATETIDSTRARRWLPLSVDLARWSGQSVELELVTSARLVPGWRPAALWGRPVLTGPVEGAALNVLWISVDALRADAVSSFHEPSDDERFAHAAQPALDAWLPSMPGLAPHLEQLAREGTIFVHAWSASTWSRPGTLAMLCGALNSDLGLSTGPWMPPEEEKRAFYASDAPLLARLVRRAGYATAALVNNFYMVGHANLGLDMGFEALRDHRQKTLDTAQITAATLEFLEQHQHRRFALFLHLNSPHSPYAPPRELEARVPPPPRGPADSNVRKYLGEVAKDDAAIGTIVEALARLHLDDRTLVIVAADHAETLSSAHDLQVLMDGAPIQMRFRHAPANWEETSRIPLLLRLPGKVPAGLRVTAAVQHTDLLPTFLELAGLPIPGRVTGRSLVPALRGGTLERRPVIVEGRGTRAVQDGTWRMIRRDDTARLLGADGFSTDPELFDLARDPGERSNVMSSHRDEGARLTQLLNARIAAPGLARGLDPALGRGQGERARLAVRFAGGARARKVSGWLKVEGAQASDVSVSDVGRVSSRVAGGRFEVTLDTDPREAAGFDWSLPQGATPSWEFFLDGAPWPSESVFVGPLGIARADAARGVSGDALALALGLRPPFIAAGEEVGLYVVIDRAPGGDSGTSAPAGAAAETMKLLQDWGYAAKPDPARP